MMTIFRNSTQDGMKFKHLCQRFREMISWKGLYKLRICESVQIKTVFGIVRHGDSSEDIDAQLSKVEHYGEEEHRSETPNAKL